MPRAPRWTDDDLRAAVAASRSLKQVCELLGVAAGGETYRSLRQHIARLGIEANHLPNASGQRVRSLRSWTDDDLREVVRTSRSVSEVQRRLGYKPSGGMHRYITARMQRLGIDTSHFTGQAWLRGLRVSTRPKRPLTEILVENSTVVSNGNLRRRLIREGLKEARCEICGLDAWRGEPLPLALDHVNGNHIDNRLENLRILCPNCHALTDTWCGRDLGRARPRPARRDDR